MDVATTDIQASLKLPAGAFPSRRGQTAVSVRIEPLPGPASPDPLEASVLGNAYRYTATYQPSGETVTSLAGPAVIGMIFPSPELELHAFIITSPDGARWERRPSTLSSTGSGYAQAHVRSLGTFAVAIVGDSPYGDVPADGGAGFPWWALAVGVLILAIGAFAPLPGRRRRSRNELGA
jgi:hypothetical protein